MRNNLNFRIFKCEDKKREVLHDKHSLCGFIKNVEIGKNIKFHKGLHNYYDIAFELARIHENFTEMEVY